MSDIRVVVQPLDGAQAMREVETPMLRELHVLADVVGARTVEILTTPTTEMRPATRKGDAPRPAYPGHWASIPAPPGVVHLVDTYRYEVEDIADGAEIVLHVGEGLDYAEELEARDGFWVISGVDDRGGPVEQALRQAAGEAGLTFRATL